MKYDNKTKRDDLLLVNCANCLDEILGPTMVLAAAKCKGPYPWWYLEYSHTAARIDGRPWCNKCVDQLPPYGGRPGVPVSRSSRRDGDEASQLQAQLIRSLEDGE